MNAVTMITTFAALGGALAFVGWPLAHPIIADDRESARSKRRTALDDEKERLLALLHDLEHDFATGKLEETDYRTLSARLKVDAAKVLKEIDVNEGRRVMRTGDEPEAREPAKPKTEAPAKASAANTLSPEEPTKTVRPKALAEAETDARFCTKCGRKAKNADDRFCGKCGAALPAADGDE
ncbi:MAG TPA: zinc ribbon domain-containing protein [bacterium]|nr:zinc ribbon domain-containing protein [bacterium]